MQANKIVLQHTSSKGCYYFHLLQKTRYEFQMQDMRAVDFAEQRDKTLLNLKSLNSFSKRDYQHYLFKYKKLLLNP